MTRIICWSRTGLCALNFTGLIASLLLNAPFAALLFAWGMCGAGFAIIGCSFVGER